MTDTNDVLDGVTEVDTGFSEPLQTMTETVEAHGFLTTSINDYTVSEGFLLVITVILLIRLILGLFDK